MLGAAAATVNGDAASASPASVTMPPSGPAIGEIQQGEPQVADATHYDLIVIGGGPAGYVGAIRAAQLGLKTACVERDKLGGVCLNWGCIPSKALLHSAEIYQEAVTRGDEWGLSFHEVSVDWKKMIGRSRSITGVLSKGVAFLFKKNKIDHHQGHAKIVSGRTAGKPCRVELSEPTGDYYHGTGAAPTGALTADSVLIATGAAPKELPFAPCDGRTVITSYDAMNLPAQPKSMVIVGSGAIGMEFAYFYNAFGTKVTVVEILDRILPLEDEEISKLAKRAFSKQGITFHVGHTVEAIDVGKGSGQGSKRATATVGVVDANDATKKQTVECDVVLVAIGVRGRFDGLFDDGLGLAVDGDRIKVDYLGVEAPTYQTNVPGLFAVGDVIGPPWLAHLAMEEAVACVERIAGHETRGVDYGAIPACTYCSPQIASIGLTEAQAREKGIEYGVGRYQLRPTARRWPSVPPRGW
jgi:dihydrolipoamide dehydrogenase